MLKRLSTKWNSCVERFVFAQPTDRFFAAFSRHNSRSLQYPVAVSPAEGGMIKISEGVDSVYVGRVSRVKNFKHGVAARLSKLAGEYFLGHVAIQPGDLVIDVGSNVGEFSKIVAGMGARTISVEPEPIEAAAIRMNVTDPKAVIINSALWSEEKDLTFYSKNSSGDSSLIEMADPEGVTTIHAITLDKLYAEHGQGQRVRLLKLEAEGAEPEILDGATNMLSFVDYISADLGPERGITAENTFIPVYNRLAEAGFRPIAFGHERGVFLFERADAG